MCRALETRKQCGTSRDGVKGLWTVQQDAENSAPLQKHQVL